MPRAAKACSTTHCPGLAVPGRTRCQDCERAADKQRGTAFERGYTSKGHQLFRAAVLARDPICVLCELAVATVADHWPLSRRELVEQGLDPNDPERGRGLCKQCHDRETARNQPGGWNNYA